MFRKILVRLLVAICFIYPFSIVHADPKPNPWPAIWQAHEFYFGVNFGYGNTDWSQLVAQPNDQIEYYLLSVSTPIKAGDQGPAWGIFTGWEVQPHFAMELNYVRFPNTKVTFDQYSVYATRYNVVNLDSNTYTYSFIGKFMVQIARTGIRGFANAGGALVHRQDELVDAGRITPTFGVGLNYVLAQRVFLELGFQYYAGFGKATLTPAVNYTPFLYSVTAKLGYRI